MIKGKDKNQIMQLMSFIKEHPDSVLSSSPKPDKKEGTKSKNISSKEKKTKEKLESKKNIIQQNASEAKNENSLEDEVNVQIKNEIQPTQMEIKNEIDKDEDRKYFRSVSPFDNNNTDNVNDNKNNNLDKKDRMDIKYDNQSRFLSTRTEIKPGDVTSNHKSNNILKKDKMKLAREKKEDNRSQFIFQDGPINLDIF